MTNFHYWVLMNLTFGQIHCFTVSYSPISDWQNFTVIEKLGKLNIKILNLLKSKFKAYNIISKFVDNNEIYKYLSAADIGFIWREESVTNKVASQVKFSEYICCGLLVISNSNVDLITSFVKEYKIEKILNNFS